MQEMEEDGLPASACGGWRQTALMLRWLKTVVVSVQGEGALDASGGDQEDVPEAPVGEARGVRC